jgi:hypothetical protein
MQVRVGEPVTRPVTHCYAPRSDDGAAVTRYAAARNGLSPVQRPFSGCYAVSKRGSSQGEVRHTYVSLVVRRGGLKVEDLAAEPASRCVTPHRRDGVEVPASGSRLPWTRISATDTRPIPSALRTSPSSQPSTTSMCLARSASGTNVEVVAQSSLTVWLAHVSWVIAALVGLAALFVFYPWGCIPGMGQGRPQRRRCHNKRREAEVTLRTSRRRPSLSSIVAAGLGCSDRSGNAR